MKRFLFLPVGVCWALAGLLLFSFMKLETGQICLILVLAGMLAFAARRANIPYRETLKSNGEIYISPVHGRVESVRLNVPVMGEGQLGHEVRISMSVWDEKGLYLPTAGEVSYLKANKGKKIPRNAEGEAFYGPMEDVAHTDLILGSKNQTKTLLRFVDGQYGLRPRIWLKSGDRGRGAACFGYYPFGGTLLIYLPKNCDVLVYESERVAPGQTVVASIKDVT